MIVAATSRSARRRAALAFALGACLLLLAAASSPEACIAPTIAPMLVPAIACTRMPRSSR